MEGHNSITWNRALAKLIAREGEKCAGLAWLYTEAERYYSKNNSMIALPVIVLSTLTGFFSGSSTLLFSGSELASIGTGAVSLFTGILSTVGSYYAWAKKAEACRISALQYSKLQKVILIEMTLPKNERVPAPVMLKMMRDNVERLLETSPAVPAHIIEKFNAKFIGKGKPDIAHPEITNGIAKVEINEEDTSIPKETMTEVTIPTSPMSVKSDDNKSVPESELDTDLDHVDKYIKSSVKST